MPIGGSGSAVQYSNANFNGWNVWITFGVSYSPGLSPYGIEIANMNVACASGAGCASQPLVVSLSDTGFTQVANGGLGTFYSNTGTGTTTQTASADTSDTPFGTLAAGLIGTISLTKYRRRTPS